MLRRALRTHGRFLLLLGLFIAGVLAQRTALPPMEGGDEYLHYNYVQFLVAENRLPDRTAYETNSTRQQSGQPPLVYWAASLLMRLFQTPLSDGVQLLDRYEQLKNPWYAPPDPWNRSDNRNLHFQNAGEQSFATADMQRADQIIRFAALGFGLLAVVGAYGAAREVFTQPSWALTATVLFAFTPQMIHISAFVNTDVGAVAFTTLAVWQALRLLRRGANTNRLLLTGALMGLAALSKINTLLALPALGAAIFIDAYKRRNSPRQIFISIILFILPLALLVGPWVLYGAVTFQDPLGTRTHLRPGYYFDQPLSLIEIVPLLPEIYLSYWGKLASAVYLHAATYTILGLVLLLALAGYGVSIGRILSDLARHAAVLVVLGVLVAGSAAGLVHWLQTIQFITGRLLYPAHIAIAMGVTSGLRLLARRGAALGKAARLFAVTAVTAAGVMMGPLSLHTAYAPPALLDAKQLPALQGSPFEYEGVIRFLGYRQESSIVTGGHHIVELCWEVLQSTARPAAFSIKFVRDGAIIADRTSVHGLGRYFSPLWQPGDRFCDRVTVPFSNPPQPGQTYDMLLVLLDARTQAVDWQASALDGTAIQFPIIGQVMGG